MLNSNRIKVATTAAARNVLESAQNQLKSIFRQRVGLQLELT